MTGELSVGQVARRAGVPVSTLHFYEAKGLIQGHRTAGNQQRYHPGVLRRVAVIRVAQDVGISLAEIADALRTIPEAPSREDWTRLAEGWRAALDRRVLALERLRDGLADCIGCGCLSLDRCQLRNRDDRLSRLGPGPRLLIGDG